MGEFTQHESSKDSEASLGHLQATLDNREEGAGTGGLDFRRESGQRTGSGGRAVHTGRAEPCWAARKPGDPGCVGPTLRVLTNSRVKTLKGIMPQASLPKAGFFLI